MRGSRFFLSVLFLFTLGVLGANAGEKPAPLTFRWTSVAGFLLDDGETTLSFDPIFTRPGIAHWFGLKELIPDLGAIDEQVNFLGLKKIDAVFVSHEHFDHAVDAPEIAHRFGATLYGGPSLERLARANETRFAWKGFRFQSVANLETIQIGKFRIKFIRRPHAAIFPAIGFHFLSGEVPKDFAFGLYQYYDGDVWCWLVEHPAGRVFVDQGSHLYEGAREDLAKGADFMLLGVANKESVADFVEKYVVGYHPKLVVPLHFDFFFTELNREGTRFLPGIEYEKIVSEAARLAPATRFRLPKFGERIRLE